MDDKDLKNVLSVVLNAVNAIDFLWRLEGSANLRVQGVEVKVNDLDITTTKEGIAFFRKALKDFIVNDFFKESIGASSLVFDIKGFEVEVNAYEDDNLGMFDKIELINWKGFELPVLPLPYAKKFYELIGREEKVKLISEYLQH